jgi:hypothetical protein
MRTIPLETVEERWREVLRTRPENLQPLVEDFASRQPWLLSYLLTVGGKDLNEAARSALFLYGYIIWRIMGQENPHLKQIDDDLIVAVDEENARFMDRIGVLEETEFFRVVEEILKQHPQQPLLRVTIEALIEEASAGDFNDFMAGLIFVYLKNVIDCIQRADEMREPGSLSGTN